MDVLDFNGACQVNQDDELLARLKSVRRGTDGAFILSHGGDDSLWIHIHGDAAVAYFFPDPDGKKPMCVPDGMWDGEKQSVDFRLVNGTDADLITVPWWQLVSVEAAYRAAVEYLRVPVRPASVSWVEL